MKKLFTLLVLSLSLLSCDKEEDCMVFTSLRESGGQFFVFFPNGDSIEVTEAGYDRARIEQQNSDGDSCYNPNWENAQF